ncbi:signal peptide peptidase SppA [Lachnospiraceae bacterium NSJ-143]|nr:signal peptide peptidase SppA [Lachnospiraceae bacterium NSJ-143]
MDNTNSSMGFNNNDNSFYQNSESANKQINYNTNYNTNYNKNSGKNGCLIAAAVTGGVLLIIAVGIILLLAFIFSLAAGAVGSAVSTIDSGRASSSYYTDGDYVETLYFEGTLIDNGSYYSSGYNHQWTLDEIDALIDDDYNKGLILYLDSPGGGTYESDEMYQKIMKYKDTTGRPVYAYMGKQATSGALYIAMAADKIYASRMTLTGSIGVIMSNYDLSGLMEKLGIQENNVKSGPNKDMFGSTGYTDEQKNILQSIIDENYNIFVNVVAESRGMSFDEAKSLADGRVYSAIQAQKAGLIDYISNYDKFMESMYDISAFADCSFVENRNESYSIIDKLLSSAKDANRSESDAELYSIFEKKNESPFNYIYEN